MYSFNKYESQPYAPSAPSLPDSSSSYDYQQQEERYGVSNYYGQQSQGLCWFPPGTHPDVIRIFHMVDRDRSGFIDQFELQQALSSAIFSFNPRTIRLLIFLFNNRNDSLRIGPSEFNALWICLGHWRGIFERFDKDCSGKIDVAELREALFSIGCATPPSVLQVLISKYDNGYGHKVELDFDSFVECGMIVKGLSEKFKEKDPGYTGSATLSYDTFMCMIIPYIVS